MLCSGASFSLPLSVFFSYSVTCKTRRFLRGSSLQQDAERTHSPPHKCCKTQFSPFLPQFSVYTRQWLYSVSGAFLARVWMMSRKNRRISPRVCDWLIARVRPLDLCEYLCCLSIFGGHTPAQTSLSHSLCSSPRAIYGTLPSHHVVIRPHIPSFPNILLYYIHICTSYILLTRANTWVIQYLFGISGFDPHKNKEKEFLGKAKCSDIETSE